MEDSATPVKEVGESATPVKEVGESANPFDPVGESATPVKEVGESANPFNPVGESATPVKEVGESATPVKEVGESANPFDPVGESATPVKEVGESANPFDPVGESATPVKEVGESANPFDPVGESATPVKEVGESATPFDPVGESATPVCPVGESATPVCPVGESATPVCPVGESATPVCPVGESATPVCPVGESATPVCPVEEAGPPCPQMEKPGVGAGPMGAPATLKVQMEGAVTPGHEVLTPFPPGEDGSTNPFSLRLEPMTPGDLSRLYPPNPRGSYSPPHVSPPSQPGPRDDYFVLRPGCIEEAIKDIGSKLPEEKLQFQNSWLLTEVDNWNREGERLVSVTPTSLLLCQYDFVALDCNEVLRVPLNYIDTITHGPFTFPETSFSRRAGTGLRIQWDKLREASFLERWNPWSRRLPHVVLTDHPAASKGGATHPLCQMHTFRVTLTEAVSAAHRSHALPGRANGVLLLEQPIRIDTYLGIISSLTNWTQLGYAKPRGTFGF